MIRKGKRNNPPSVYSVGETVLIRYPPSKKISSKRSILEAKVMKRNLKISKYKVKFVYPAGSSCILQEWISVSDITSTTMEEEKRKRAFAKVSGHGKGNKTHRKKYFIPFANERELFTDVSSNQQLSISFDPTKDGNCQFSALCNELKKVGIFGSSKTLREEIVAYLESHPNTADGTPLELFAGMPWNQYKNSMARQGTYGDHLTLQAAADVFQIEIVVYSTLGPSATQNIAPTNGIPLATFYLGHFAEGAGEHYVCLADHLFHEHVNNDLCYQGNVEDVPDRQNKSKSAEYKYSGPTYPESVNIIHQSPVQENVSESGSVQLSSSSNEHNPNEQANRSTNPTPCPMHPESPNNQDASESESIELPFPINGHYERDQSTQNNVVDESFLNPDILEKVI